MPALIAADSAKFLRGKSPREFVGLVGVTIDVSDAREFKDLYRVQMANFFTVNKLKQEKIVYNSETLLDKFFRELHLGRQEYCQSLERMLTEMSRKLRINIFYSTCNPGALPQPGKVVIFTGEASAGATETIHPVQFLRDWLSQYHHQVCAWKLTKVIGLSNQTIWLDGFRGPITESWNELVKSNTVKIVPFGDECNPYISASDLLARYVDEALRRSGIKINDENISKAVNLPAEQLHVHYTFHNDLAYMVPLFKGGAPTGKQIYVGSFYSKPMIYILKEGSALIREDTDWLKGTRFFTKLCDLAFERDASIKIYDRDQDRVEDGDALVHYGPKGQRSAIEMEEILRGLGQKVEVIDSLSLLAK